MINSISITRGDYSQITKMPTDISTLCTRLLKGVVSAEKIDEHGGWDFSADFDSKGRGSALNYDWYGVGFDQHDGGFLGVLQVRQYVKVKKNYFPEIKKSYFLVGYNEDNTCFSHPVESRVIHSAIKRGADVVTAVQSWIFGTDYTKVIRQGDLCLIPVRSVKGVQISSELVLQGSHRLLADKIYENGDFYAVNPNLYHLNGTHPTLQNLVGKYKVVVGKRASFWSFAKPTID
jgi:hypothetical protein